MFSNAKLLILGSLTCALRTYVNMTLYFFISCDTKLQFFISKIQIKIRNKNKVISGIDRLIYSDNSFLWFVW